MHCFKLPMFIFGLVGSFLPEQLKRFSETHSWRFTSLSFSIWRENNSSSNNSSKKTTAEIRQVCRCMNTVFPTFRTPHLGRQSTQHHLWDSGVLVSLIASRDKVKRKFKFRACLQWFQDVVEQGWKWTREAAKADVTFWWQWAHALPRSTAESVR